MTDNSLAPQFNRYQQLVNDISTSIHRNCYVYGGRGIGKSGFLKQIKVIFEKGGQKVKLIDGRNRIDAYKEFNALYEAAEKDVVDFHLLFDNLDHFCHEYGDFFPDSLNEVIPKLDYLFKTLSSNRFRVIATGNIKPLEMLTAENLNIEGDPLKYWNFFWSRIQAHWDNIRLDPWVFGWEDKITNFISMNYSSKMPASSLNLWIEVIIEQTGGHPAMVDSSIRELHRIINSTNISPIERKLIQDIEDHVLDVRESIIRHLQDHLVQKDLNRVRRRIALLRSSKDVQHINAYEELKKLALGSTEIPSYDIREILADEALIYENKSTGLYIVPGKLLKKEILIGAIDSETLSNIQIIELDSGDIQRGRLIASLGNTPITIDLKGATWKILKSMAMKNNYSSVEQLVKLTQLPSVAAVRSAIQRLEQKLKGAGLDGLIENKRGQGYKLRYHINIR